MELIPRVLSAPHCMSSPRPRASHVQQTGNLHISRLEIVSCESVLICDLFYLNVVTYTFGLAS